MFVMLIFRIILAQKIGLPAMKKPHKRLYPCIVDMVEICHFKQKSLCRLYTRHGQYGQNCIKKGSQNIYVFTLESYRELRYIF